MFGAQFRRPVAGEPVTITAAPVQLYTLLTGGALNAGVTRLTLQNIGTDRIYWAFKATAPAAVTDMAILDEGIFNQFAWEERDLLKLWVASANAVSSKAYVLQEGA